MLLGSRRGCLAVEKGWCLMFWVQVVIAPSCIPTLSRPRAMYWWTGARCRMGDFIVLGWTTGASRMAMLTWSAMPVSLHMARKVVVPML